MSLSGTFDVVKLTDTELVLSKTETLNINSLSTKTVTAYSYHKLVENPK